MTYSEAVAFLLGLQRHGIKLGLDSTLSLLSAIGAPHRSMRALHIGGTNGKGSTAALAASMAQAAGYRVGLYTSPHLIDFRERIRINGVPIPESSLAELTARVRAACPPTLAPTFFEFTTALAFLYFMESKVDVAVLEVGLGGRFDATNVVVPLVSCITTVAMDHEAYLGPTLRSIAFEKAGIIKPGVPLVIGALDPEARTVVTEIAREREAPLLALGVDFQIDGPSPAACVYRTVAARAMALSCPLRGRHQLDNLACAVAVMQAASARGLAVDESAVRRGAAEVQWPGRLEVVGERPRLILDGAHNPAAATVVAAYLAESRRTVPGARVWAVVGMMQDKDHAAFFQRLLPEVDEVILTVPNLARSASSEDLRASIPSAGPPVRLIPRVSEAIRTVLRLAAPDDLICVTGSLMLIGEVKAALQGVSMSPLRG